MALTFQPVGKDAPDPEATCEQLTDEMKQAGFVRFRRETKPFRSAPAVCLIAEKGAIAMTSREKPPAGAPLQ